MTASKQLVQGGRVVSCAAGATSNINSKIFFFLRAQLTPLSYYRVYPYLFNICVRAISKYDLCGWPRTAGLSCCGVLEIFFSGVVSRSIFLQVPSPSAAAAAAAAHEDHVYSCKCGLLVSLSLAVQGSQPYKV